MRYLILFLFAFFSISAGPFTAIQQSAMITNNILENPGFESGKVRWTASGGSFTLDTSSNLGFGSTSAAWDASGSQTFCSPNYTIPKGWYGAVGKASLMYKGGDGLLSWSVETGGDPAVVHRMKANTNFEVDQAYFSIPTSGTMSFCVTATGNAAVVYLDQIFVGLADRTASYGAPEINLITNPNDSGNWFAGSNMTVATTITSSELPLGNSAQNALQTIPTAIKITRASGTNSVSTRFTVPTALKNRKLKIQWEQHPISGYASGDLKLQLSSNTVYNFAGSTTTYALSTDASGVTGIPNMDGRFTAYFDADSANYYELDITGVAGTTALVIGNVIVGPGIQAQGAALSEAQSWTPTGSWSSNTTYTGQYWRKGSRGLFNAKIALTGAPTNAALTINMPTGLTINSSVVNTAIWASNFGLASTNQAYDMQVDSNGNTSSVQVVYQNAVSGSIGTLDATHPLTWANTHTLDVWWEVPVAEWAGSGTVNIAQNDIEYVWNSGSSTTVDDLTSFGYGPAGTTQVAFSTSGTSAVTRRVRFQTPIADGDVLTLQYLFNGATKWVDAATLSPFTSNDAGTTYYGAALRTDLPGGGSGNQATDCDVTFFSARVPGLAWNTGAKWRVVKQKGGQAVGFGQVTQSSSGLVKNAGQLLGTNTNDTALAGFVGEYFENNATEGSISVTSGTITDVNSTGITLTPGCWDITGSIDYTPAASTSVTRLESWIGTATGNSSTGQDVTRNFAAFETAADVLGSNRFTFALPTYRVTISSNTSYYLKANAVFTVSTLTAGGTIRATRVR